MVFGGTAGLRTSARRRRGCLLGKYQSRAPPPAKRVSSLFLLAFGGASLLVIIICPATAGVALLTRQKCPKAIQGCALKTRRTGTPARKVCDLPERGLNGAYKVPQAHLPPPNLPRFGGGERPPFCCKPPPPLTITMGQRPGSLRVTD